MVDFKNITDFEWDNGNLNKNKSKHGVESYECEEIFFNRPIIINVDFKHSQMEERFYALGITDKGRKLFVVFALRRDLVRIISARDMSKKEHKIYEKEYAKN